MNTPINLSKKKFAVYGLGTTGKSAVNYLNKLKFKNYIVWDDNRDIQNSWNLNKKKEKIFFKSINTVDYILISPGINIEKTKVKKTLFKNKHKFITDLDLFYMVNPNIKSIVVTGTNGKSTTCKIIQHLLNKNNISTQLGGNIGNPVLSLNLKKKPTVIIEASSFQLSYSKFVKPHCALLLNITRDHLDWHGNMKNYINAKLKIFSLQEKNDFAFINNKKILRKFRKNKHIGNLKFVTYEKYMEVKNYIKNEYLNSDVNRENMSFVYSLSKIFKINKKSFIKSFKSFKGLPHRHEIFLRKNNKVFINDSKATSFEASKSALKNNQNIFWIVGGLPKIGDKFKFNGVKKNIIKAYIIGKHMNKFTRYLKNKVIFKKCKNLDNAVNSIFRDIKNIKNMKITILFSPASASYDQFKNFEDRGNKFKKLIKKFK